MQRWSITSPDLTVNSTLARVLASNFSVLFCTSDHWETTWTQALVGCMSSVDDPCVRREMTDSWARLSAATRFPLQPLSCRHRLLVPPNVCVPQVLFVRLAEHPSDRHCGGKVQRESRSKARAHSHVVLGSRRPWRT